MLRKATTRQKSFLIFYPFVYVIFSTVALWMSVSAGIGPGDTFPSNVPILLSVISAVGSVLIQILWAPILTIEKMGIKLPGYSYLDYVWFFIVGIFYGLVFLTAYKYFRNK